MVDTNKLKAIILLRHQPLIQDVGSISEDLCDKLIAYAKTNAGDLKQSIQNREQHSSNKSDQALAYDITEFYDQVYIRDDAILKQLKTETNIDIDSVRIGVLQPESKLDWHIDYEPNLRIHIDLSADSIFNFRVGEEHKALKKKRLTVYKLNASYYHMVENPTKEVRYALIGNFVDEV